MNTVIDRVSFAIHEGHPVNASDIRDLLNQHVSMLSSVRHAVLVLDDVAQTTSQRAAIRSMKDAIKTCDEESR